MPIKKCHSGHTIPVYFYRPAQSIPSKQFKNMEFWEDLGVVLSGFVGVILGRKITTIHLNK